MMKSKNHTYFLFRSSNSHSGVSLFEVVLAIVLIGVFAVVGSRAVTSMDDARRFQYTLQAMETMREKIVGNPQFVQTGFHAILGYLSYEGNAPGALSDLDYTYWITPDAFIKTTDGWNNAYIYEDGSGDSIVDITSRGSDNAAGGSGFASDLDINIPLAAFVNNTVRVYCVDRAGHALLNGSTSGKNMIDSVGIYINGVNNACSYDSEGFWEDTGLDVGPCVIRVTPNATWRTELCGDAATTYLEAPAFIFSRASFTENEINIFEFRFPGEATTDITT
ncbi:type II secretion system protein GspG [Candidatus Omnitrophota bacterium]